MTKLTFNGVDMPDFVQVLSVSFDALSDIQISETGSLRQIGSTFGRMKRGGAVCSVTVLLKTPENKTMFDMKDDLKRWLKGDNWKPSPLIFSKKPDRYLLATINNSVNINDLFDYGETTFDFYASDPRFYSLARIETEVTALNGVYNTQLDYLGIEDSTPLITINTVSKLTNIKITIGKKTLVLDAGFPAGATVIIDNKRKQIRLNGVNFIKALVITSDWLSFEPGLNIVTVKLTNATTTVSDAAIGINYRIAY